MIPLSDIQKVGSAESRAAGRFPWWIVVGGALLACLYLPTLATRFDFVDDGNLVYPSDSMPLGQRLHWAWEKVAANYQILGPFRPVLWCHWEVEAELFGANPFYWRVARLVWTALSAGVLLWLLRELGIRTAAAFAAAALAIWNPYRNEIWTSLTLAEGVAMPYALFALICALRAARGSNAGVWDVLGVLCMLAAMGCKNTFAAVVPAQVYLRMASDGSDFLGGLRRHGRRAGLLALTLLLPAAHYVYFTSHWHPGQYALQGPSWAQLERMVRAVSGAVSPDFVGIGLAVAMFALAIGRLSLHAVPGKEESLGLAKAAEEKSNSRWTRYRAAMVAGLLLLSAGIAAYMPINAVSGRYTIPAVWGLDLILAALLSAVLEEAPPKAWKAAFTAFACGLVCVAAANLGRQQKVASRADLLWNSLEWVEEQAPAGAIVAWQCGPTLGVEEGIHFNWHLQGRGRKKVSVVLVNEQGRPFSRPELPLKCETLRLPDVVITGASTPPGDGWQMQQAIRVGYWMSKRSYECYVWIQANQEHGADASTE